MISDGRSSSSPSKFSVVRTQKPDRPNMFYGSSELSQASPQITQKDKLFSRLVSKESSFAYPSVRVYYGGVAGAVPFQWESRPGTPKHPLSEKLTPPLTPPPSYNSNFSKKSAKKQQRSNLLNALFSRLDLRKINLLSPSSSRTSFLSSSSSFAMATANCLRCSQFSDSPRGSSGFDSKEYEEEEASRSPTSTLCFGLSRGRLN